MQMEQQTDLLNKNENLSLTLTQLSVFCPEVRLENKESLRQTHSNHGTPKYKKVECDGMPRVLLHFHIVNITYFMSCMHKYFP